MAADVGYFVRVMNDNDSAAAAKSTALITRDLLGGAGLDSKELDLDLQVPSGWEKRLDLKSGKVYLQRCHSPNASSSDQHKHHQINQTVTKQLQDLNFPPCSKQPLNLFNDGTNLDLKLVSSSAGYQSVCTLDKVKFALERAEKQTLIRKRSMLASPCSNSSSSSSVKEMTEIEYDEEKSSSPSYAAGCPSCLLYVLISKSNPKCPRCNTIVPSPTAMKKPRIDLNI